MKRLNKWSDKEIKYIRLIAEAQVAGAFSNKVLHDMADSMDLEWTEVIGQLDDACDEFDEIKAKL